MIELERAGEVFILRMRGGENKLNRELLDGVNAALDEVERSEGPAALVTIGEERFYSTGLDLGWLATQGGPGINEFLADLHLLLARLLAFPMATVAALNGHAFAGGAFVAFAHDFRVMREDKGFVCMPEVDLAMGQPLTPGFYAVLDARLPRATIHEMLLTGRRYNASEALERQLVSATAPEAEVLSRSIDIARGLAAKHRATFAALKEGLYQAELAILRAPLPQWLAGS
jgi:enoyl-CoA hydratase/carnithine racemase